MTVEIDRQGLLDAVSQVLDREGLPASAVEVGLRSVGAMQSRAPAVLVFIRLNAWRPEALLRGKIIEKRLRDALRSSHGVRVGYVYWRIGGDVDTPFDYQESFAVQPTRQRLGPLQAQAAARGAMMADDAPVTDWAELAAPTDAGDLDLVHPTR